ncbi:hypothetical protein J2751_001763 [Halorubrum alkaliphilum]|uniref:Uncharacterized protein n=1 Tax=Halorubrum alkaliphilum TaxID=261290 RepID=A0A8T4GG96_9EURY|nr:DUF5793 family protein [Halorubrum alkaliphilum]MBP1922749.1 hypothetical protein [Halorubrum alkaliphilum]
MRRDYFDLTVEGVGDDADGPTTPLVRIDFHGPEGLLRDRLSGADGDLLEGESVDVAFRLQQPLSDGANAEGVVGVTNRYTGDFVLELNETADDVLPFIRAARESADGDDARFRIEIDIEGERLVTYDQDTFLVYDRDGNLLRSESLIPSGVEL